MAHKVSILVCVGRLEEHPRLILGTRRGVVVLGLEGQVGRLTIVDVKLRDEVDLHPADLACAIGHALDELAAAPAKVLEAQDGARAGLPALFLYSNEMVR